MSSLMPSQREMIFTIIKPGFLDKSQKIIDLFKARGWDVLMTTTKQLLLSQAHELYAVHKNKDFYDDLCEYMSSDRSMAIIFERPGRTDKSTFEEVKNLKDTIRKRWGIDDCKNVLHSSDSFSAMTHEMGIYF